MRSITSANSKFMLTLSDLYAYPIEIQGYSADTMFTFDSINPTEIVMGVDGKISAGFVPQPIKQKIQIQPDQDSMLVFDEWFALMQQEREVFYADATITIPSMGKTYTLTKGVLSSYKPMPDAKKTLQAQEYEITWESVSSANI